MTDGESFMQMQKYLLAELFGWLFGFGGKIEFVALENVRQDYYNMVAEVIKLYGDNGQKAS